MAKKRLAKAVDTPRGPGTSMTPVSPYQVALQVSYGQSSGITRGTGADWFGPLNPMAPIAPPEVAGRQFDYVPGTNLVTTPRSGSPVGFPMMRALADSYDLLRLVIETRKDQLCKNKWKVRVKKADGEKDAPDADDDQKALIAKITTFLKRPDGINRWRPWLRSVLEDLFVIDAPALYCQRNRGGALIALKQIDGGTVKVVIDDWGRTPMPYVGVDGKQVFPPAYQQVLKGFPAVNYTVRDVIYRPYNKRVHKIYGYSPVEQVIMTVNIALRRQAFTLAYYTEGNIPESLIGTPDTWTPEQVGAFQKMWDQMFTGNLAARRHAKFVPGGVAKTYIPTKEPDLKNPLDDWLARIICFAFSISPQQLVQAMNRATAQTSADQSKEEGVEPVKEYVVELMNDVIENEFGADDLEFAFDEEIEVDQVKQQTIITGYVDSGLKTINQGRVMMGDEPDPNPAADQLMVKTATGYVPIESATIEGKQAAIDAGITADPTIPPVIAPPQPGGGAFNPSGGGKAPPPKPGATGKAPPKPAAGSKTAPKPAAKHAPHAITTGAFNKAARRARRLAPIPFDRPKARAVAGTLTKTIHGALRKVAAGVAKQVRADLDKVRKASKDDDPDTIAQEIADAADLSAITTIVPDVADDLEALTTDTGRMALAQVGASDEAGLVDTVNDKAVEIARQLAAELVGMRYNDDGDLVPAVRAEYRIDDSTRNMIRDLIANGLEDNIGTDAIADSIEDATAFSEDRSELIANTEVRRANSSAALEGYKTARDDDGVNVKKEWLLGEQPCDICLENSEEGPIDLDEDFPSGDDAPPAHPNCECAVSPVVETDNDKTDEDETDE